MYRQAFHARWLWTLASAAGTGVGAYLAMRYFPEAGFAKHPTGQYGPYLYGFAVSVALPLALAQFVLLASFLGSYTPGRLVLLLLWIPATAVGVMAMILPLWSWDAFVFAIMPLAVAVVMLPGAVLMGLAQNVILYALFGTRIYWAALTVVGAVIGSVAGLVLAFMLQPMPLEVVWGIVTGAGIGATQGHLLGASLGHDGDHPRPDHGAHFPA
jgi:hypothetical protein